MGTSSISTHIGRKISRIRELKNMKQDTLAFELGVSQQSISRIEASEVIEDEVLEKVAKVLGVTGEAIRNFSDEAVINYINNFNDSSVNHGPLNNNNCTFNPLDRLMDAIEENKKLYERLLQGEREKIETLKEIISQNSGSK